MDIHLPVSSVVESPGINNVNVSINEALTENVGGCSFTAPTDPTSIMGVEFRVTFSAAIDDSTFTTSDITNGGTGGGIGLSWSITNCGDDMNFKLTATSVVGDGTIIPSIAASAVQTSDGGNNLLSTATDNSVTVVRGWYQEAYFKAVNAETGDYFGTSVTIGGDTLVVSAQNESSNQNTILNGATASGDNSNTSSGAVYVYKRSGANWTQEAYIKAANNDANDKFGASLSISGNSLAIGVPLEDSNQSTITNGTTASSDNTNVSSGAVYVYKRTGTTWLQEAYIKAVNNDFSDKFGNSVSLSNDTLAVGAPEEDSNLTTITNGSTASGNNGNLNSGATYIYKRSGATWAQEAYIKAVNNDIGDNFGNSVSVSGDRLIVSAKAEASNQSTITNGATASADDTSSSSGAVFVYKRQGVLWTQEAFIKASNNNSFDNFGIQAKLNGDTIVVGAWMEDSNQNTITNGATSSGDNSNINSGAVYVYKRTGVTWAQEAYIKASNPDANDNFGLNLGVSGDTIVVGSSNEGSNQSTITNGTTASSDNTYSSSGATYVYQRTGTTWTQEAYIKSSNNDDSDLFAASLDISGDTIVVGAPFEDSNQTTISSGETASLDNSFLESGAVYVYRNRSRLFDVKELRTSVTSNSITLDWDKSGGTSTGYFVAYQVGATAPVDCLAGISLDAGDVATFTEIALSASTIYSFRVCATDGASYSPGMTTTLTTAP